MHGDERTRLVYKQFKLMLIIFVSLMLLRFRCEIFEASVHCNIIKFDNHHGQVSLYLQRDLPPGETRPRPAPAPVTQDTNQLHHLALGCNR